MKLNAIKPILIPGLVLIAINSALCAAFAVAAVLSIGISWIFYDYFGLPFPLMPPVFVGFAFLSLGAWFFFARRLDLDWKNRVITAAAGVCPLLAISGIALLGALTFVAVPINPGVTILGPVAVSMVAFLAAVVCAAGVIWMPQRKAAPIQETAA